MQCGHMNDGGACAAGAKPAKRSTLSGSEDMLPAGTKPQLKSDLPPSEELVRHNEMKAGVAPKAQRYYSKADLPPSEEYKKRNEVQTQPSRGPRKHMPGDMTPLSETQHLNDRNLLPRDPSSRQSLLSRHIYDHQFSSDDMKNCLVPPRNCAMSDAFEPSSRSQLSSIPEEPQERYVGRGGAFSDVSSLSGMVRRGPRSEASEYFDNESVCSRSEVDSICSRSAAGSSAFAPPARHPWQRCGGGSKAANDAESMCSRSDVDSMCSRSVAGSAAFARAARTPRPRDLRSKTATSARSSSTIESSTVPYSQCGSVASRDPPQSARSRSGISQGSFSLGGFSYDKVAARSAPHNNA